MQKEAQIIKVDGCSGSWMVKENLLKKKNNSCKRNIFNLQLLFSSYSLFFYFFILSLAESD